MLRGFTSHALALETFACCGIEVPYDIALTHAIRLVGACGLSSVSGLGVVSCLSSFSGLGMRPQLGPHGSRVALARLAIVRHAGKRNRAACRLHCTAKAHAHAACIARPKRTRSRAAGSKDTPSRRSSAVSVASGPSSCESG